MYYLVTEPNGTIIGVILIFTCEMADARDRIEQMITDHYCEEYNCHWLDIHRGKTTGVATMYDSEGKAFLFELKQVIVY